MTAPEFYKLNSEVRIPGNAAMVNCMRAFINICQNLKPGEWDDVHHTALTQWRTPQWVTEGGMGVPKFPSKKELKGGQPGLPTPVLMDTAEQWVVWFLCYQHQIVKDGTNSYPGIDPTMAGVSIRHIRGMLLIGLRALPQQTDLAVLQNCHRFLKMAAELVARTVGRFALPINNVTMDQIVTFFAMQGVPRMDDHVRMLETNGTRTLPAGLFGQPRWWMSAGGMMSRGSMGRTPLTIADQMTSTVTAVLAEGATAPVEAVNFVDPGGGALSLPPILGTGGEGVRDGSSNVSPMTEDMDMTEGGTSGPVPVNPVGLLT
ncbi:hypothetical protein DXG01_008673, partial [Tephrocybe rancida]